MIKYSRFTNYGFWIALFSAVILTLKAFGIDIPEAIAQDYKVAVEAILYVLIMAGIISNPQTTNKGFLDDKGGK